jgi:hypothetical protein
MKRAGLNVVRTTLLSASLLAALAACNRAPPAQADADAPPGPASAAAPAPAAAAYTPPTADQLYALVAPIALFPDRLVALTLAGSTHADQIDDARSFLGSQRNLTGAALIDAADNQPWDPSVKSLVAFPAVLDQLASNRDWTQALGAAYANEPTDVMNAIQVMRGRAQAHGTLRQTSQQTVQVEDAPVSQTVTTETETEIVPAPTRTIVIEPAQSDVVYVPQYDPDEVYGEPVYSRVYRTHWYEAPASRGDVVTAGLVSFGAGVLVGQLFASHDHRDGPRDVPRGGWNNWNTSWGHGPGGGDGRGRPSVVYDNHPYVVNRNTVVNRTVNHTVNNTYVDQSVHDSVRHVDVHGNGNVRGVPGVAGNPPGMQAGQAPARPDFEHMQRPNFTAAMARPTAPGERPNLPAGQARPGAQPEGMQRMDPRVANVHAVGARPQPFDNSHGTGGAPHTQEPREQPAAQQALPTVPHLQGGGREVPQERQQRPVPQQHQERAAAQEHLQRPMPQEHQERAAPQQHQERPAPQEHQQRPMPQERQVAQPPPRENHPPANHAPPPKHEEHKDHEKHDG